VRERRVPRAEVDGIEAARREVRDVRPRLLRADLEPAGVLEGSHCRRVDDARRRRVAAHRHGGARRRELREERLGLRRLAVGRVTQVQRRHRLSRDDVVGDPRVQPRHGDHLLELEAVHDRGAGRKLEQRYQAAGGALERAVCEPRPRGVTARSVERQLGDDVPQAAGLDLEIGRLEGDGERRLVYQCGAVEEGGQRIVLRR
jgi:hypothetical protein